MEEAVIVALISSGATLLAAVVAAVASIRGNRRVGKPNGQGNVVDMLENLIEWKAVHEQEHAQLHACPFVYAQPGRPAAQETRVRVR